MAQEEDKPMELMKDYVDEVPKELSLFMAEEVKPPMEDDVDEIAAFGPRKRKLDVDDSGIHDLHDLSEKKKSKLEDDDIVDNLADKDKRSLTVPVRRNDWASLPTELLALVAQNLGFSPVDFSCFSVVCKACLTAALTVKDELTPPKLPCLMLAEDEEPRGFYNLSNRKVHHVEASDISEKRCLAVNHGGWLFTIGVDFEINLFNPFSKEVIPLPPFSSFGKDLTKRYDDLAPDKVMASFFKKAAVSAHPKKGKDCMVMVICGLHDELAFARPGDGKWTGIVNDISGFEDVVHYKGWFYGVNSSGQVAVCDIDEHRPRARVIIEFPHIVETRIVQKYLVESRDCLLLISQFRINQIREVNKDSDDEEDDNGEGDVEEDDEDLGDSDSEEEDGLESVTQKFSVVKVEQGLTTMKSLGDRCLFIGGNTSVSMLADVGGGLKANCIYYTECNWHPGDDDFKVRKGGGDMGIFNLEDGSLEKHYSEKESVSSLTPPVWLV